MNNESSRKPVFDIELIDNFFTKLLKNIPDIYYIKVELGNDNPYQPEPESSVEKVFRGAMVSGLLDASILHDKAMIFTREKTNPQYNFHCECCGRGLNELEPFEGIDVLLVKHFRPLCSEDQQEAVWECRDCFPLNNEEFFKKWKEQDHQD
jgi:hypothetical protein